MPTYKMKELSFLTLGSWFFVFLFFPKIFCDSRNVPKSSYVVPVPAEVSPEGLPVRLIKDFFVL